jgi:hypothetical protein
MVVNEVLGLVNCVLQHLSLLASPITGRQSTPVQLSQFSHPIQ